MNVNLSQAEIRELYFALEDKREVLYLTLSNSQYDTPTLLQQKIRNVDALINKLMNASNEKAKEN